MKLCEIEKEIETLNREMYGLEMSDDFLFSNRSGNLPRYRAMEERVKELKKMKAEL